MPAPPDPATMPVRIGPLLVNPRIALTNFGVDDNIFNEPDDQTPERDLTMTVTPAAEVWLRMGRTWLGGSLQEDIVWFKEFESERSVNGTMRASWIVPLTRVQFAAGAGWVNTRERPGFEIDARSQRQEREFNGAAEVRMLSKTLFGVRGSHRLVEFDKDEVFLGTSLSDELTRTNTVTALTIRHELTPLTTVTIDLAREADRFEFSTLRDSTSGRLDVGVSFDPFALISGTVRFGFRDFEPASADVPGYAGTTAAIDLAYVALGSTRLTLQAMRDVQYSFDVDQPYYLQTGISGSVAQQIYGPVDVQARAGTQRLSYRTREGAVVAVPDRHDNVRSYGGGVGYRFGPDLRIGFNVDRQRRISDVDWRQYSGLRYGIGLTYGR